MASPPNRLLKKTHVPPACFKQAFRIVALRRSNVPPKYADPRRFFARRSAVFDPDPSTHRQAQGGEEDRTTMLRVMVRYSNHEAQTRRELGRSLASEIFLTSLQTVFLTTSEVLASGE